MLIAVLLPCQVLLAQHTHPTQLTVLVDGSKTPDQIPDDLAYHHFFMAASAHPTPSAQEQGRQQAMLAPIGLPAPDQQSLIPVLAQFRVQMDQIAQRRAVPGVTAAQLTSLQTQEAVLAATTVANAGAVLTQDGAARLYQWISTHVKAHIVIVGNPVQGVANQ